MLHIDDFYLEIDENKHKHIVQDMINEINLLLGKYKLPDDIIEISQIKEKWGRLRVYVCIPRLIELALDDECDEQEYYILNEVQSKLEFIIDKYELIIL